MPIEIIETPAARIEVDRAVGLVKLIRSALPVDAAGLERAVDDFQIAVPLRERPRLVLLQDMRLAPPIRDEALEKALAEQAPRLVAKFAARAVLMATAFGRLQASRFIQPAADSVRSFGDEREALAFLHAKLAELRGQAKPAKR
jgi:hypothetical protein